MAKKRGWGDKGGGSGDPNILKLEDSTKIRLIDPAGKVEFKQHVVEHKEDAEQTEFIVCPDDGNCPMCRKPEGPDGERYFSRSRRMITNVWDYGTEGVKVLIGGPQIFNKFDDAAEVGYDPTASDWVIHKSGSGKQTEYNTIRGNDSTFAHEVGPDDLHDLDKYTQPPSVEQIFELLEKMGWDYDALPVREFDEDSALAYVFPYGKCKGMTVEQVLAQDSQYADYMYSNKKTQGAYGDPLFLALHTVLEARGEVEPIPALDVTAAPPAKVETEPTPSTPSAADPTSDGEVELLTPTGDAINVPEDAVDGLLEAGFERPPEPEPEEPETVEMKKGESIVEVPAATVPDMEIAGFVRVSATESEPSEPEIVFPAKMQKDGAEVEVTDEAAMAALETAGFTLVAGDSPDDDKRPPERPMTDDGVVVTVKAGETSLPMKFGAVVTAVKNGADFKITDNEEAAEDLAKLSGVQSFEEAKLHRDANSEANGGESMEAPDPDKPHRCEFCGKGYKTPGALTQHKNREHKDAQPVATSSSEGGGDREAKMESVKTLIDKVPDLQKDYDKLLDLFDKVAGKRAISEFTEDELDKLKAELEKMVP